MDTTNVQVAPAPSFLPKEENRHAMKLNILYGSLTVHMETVNCADGCRIFYGPLHDQHLLDPAFGKILFGASNAVQVSLKRTHPSDATAEIFRNFKRGVIVRADRGNIFVTPLAPVTVYYGADPYGNSYPLTRDKTTCVFNYQKEFIPALGRYMLSKSQDMLLPPHTILSLGQQWTSQRPFIYNLISIVVIPVWAEEHMGRLGVQLAPVRQDVSEVDGTQPNQLDLVAEEFLNPSI